MGSAILGSSNLPVIGANRCSRKWVNKTDGPKIPQTKPKQVFKITLNRELSNKLIQENSLPSTAYGSKFSDKQKFHSSPKQRRPFSTEVLSNWPFVLWLQRTVSSAWWFIFLNRELSTSSYEIMHLPILRNLLILGDWQPYHLPVPLSWNLGTLPSWNPLGHSRPVTGLIYLFVLILS
jgi:hypothetical protein